MSKPNKDDITLYKTVKIVILPRIIKQVLKAPSILLFKVLEKESASLIIILSELLETYMFLIKIPNIKLDK